MGADADRLVVGVFVVFKQRHSGTGDAEARRHAGIDLGVGEGIPRHIAREDQLRLRVGLGQAHPFQGAGQGDVVLPGAFRHCRIADMAVAEHHNGVDLGMQAHLEGRIGLLQASRQFIADGPHPHQGNEEQREGGQQFAGFLKAGEPE
ncbi:hypothetical protein D3C79_622990 [compost metagenome]